MILFSGIFCLAAGIVLMILPYPLYHMVKRGKQPPKAFLVATRLAGIALTVLGMWLIYSLVSGHLAPPLN